MPLKPQKIKFLVPQAVAERSGATIKKQRVSYGSGPHRAAMGLLRRIADEAKASGTFKALTEGAVPYEEINGIDGEVN